MFSRRLATATVLLAFAGAACGGASGAKVAAGGGTVSPAAAVEATTTTATTLPPETTAVPDTGAQPTATPAPVNAKPAPASIEVDYQPQGDSSATATLTGPNGSHAKSLDSGAAVFGALPAGTYSVTITVDTPSGDPTVGDARVIINGGDVHVEAGQHGVVACDDNGCTGVLG